MSQETEIPKPPSGRGQRLFSHVGYLLLLFFGVFALTAGLLLEVGSGMLPRIDPQVALGGGLILLAVGSGIVQQLVLAGRLQYYKFADPGGSFRVPWSELPLALTAFGAGGFAVGSFWFLKTYGPTLPPLLFGIAALTLGVGAVVCWIRRAGALGLDEDGVAGALRHDRQIAWKTIESAQVVNRGGLPFIRLDVSRHALHPTSPAPGHIDFPAFDFGVPPKEIVNAINRRLVRQQ